MIIKYSLSSKGSRRSFFHLETILTLDHDIACRLLFLKTDADLLEAEWNLHNYPKWCELGDFLSQLESNVIILLGSSLSRA